MGEPAHAYAPQKLKFMETEHIRSLNWVERLKQHNLGGRKSFKQDKIDMELG